MWDRRLVWTGEGRREGWRREGLRTKRGGGRASRVRERRRGRAEAREHAGDIPK